MRRFVYFRFSLCQVFVFVLRFPPALSSPYLVRLSSPRSRSHRRVYFTLLRSTSSFSTRALLIVCLSRPRTSAPRSFMPFVQPPSRDRGETAISAHAPILMQLSRNHRDVHTMPAVESHETQRLQTKMRHDLSNITRDEN